MSQFDHVKSGPAAEVRGRRLGSPSERSRIASFMVMDVMTAAAQAEAEGRRVIHMEVGQPATAAPAAARDAACKAIENQTLGYTLALGNGALRQRIAQHYRDWYDLDIPAERIVITSGSSAAFVLAFLAVFDAGDAVALPSPGYPCYRHISCPRSATGSSSWKRGPRPAGCPPWSRSKPWPTTLQVY